MFDGCGIEIGLFVVEETDFVLNELESECNLFLIVKQLRVVK